MSSTEIARSGTGAIAESRSPGATAADLAAASATPPCNALTIDVEDYFQVEAFANVIDRADWDTRPRRVARNTERLLDIIGEAGASATFFMLGWVAGRHPELVRRIVA